jgi:predicted RNase H-like HicB family nuclease
VRSDSYIGLFRAQPRDHWRVCFPDLPGCEARGSSFKEVFEAARKALADHLAEIEGPWPRPRSSAELIIDAQRDWRLCRDFVDAVMHPVEPARPSKLHVPPDAGGLGQMSNPQLAV